MTSKKRAWVANTLVALVSLSLAVGVAELALRLVIKPRTVMTRQLLHGLGVTDADQNWNHDPVLGWTIKPNQRFHHKNPFGEFDQEIRTNALGIRIPLEGAPPAPADAERTILFVGDSITAAFEVPYEETFVSKVARELTAAGQGTRTINGGVRGYSTEQSYKQMKRLFAAGIKATDVVYVYSFNDPFENMNLHFPKRLMSKPAAYLDDAGKLKFRSLGYRVGVYDSEALFAEPGGNIGTLPIVDRTGTPHRIVANLLRGKPNPGVLDKSYVVGLIESAIDIYTTPKVTSKDVQKKYPYIKANYVPDDFGGFYPGFVDVSWEPNSYPLRLLEAIIVEMKAEAEKQGARFWLATLLGTPPESFAFFNRIAAQHDIRLIDPVKMGMTKKWVARCDGHLVFKTDGHYTACGNSGMADAIATAIKTGHQAAKQ